MNLFLTLKPGTNLTDWSLYKDSNDHICTMKDFHGGYTHFVFYSHGYYAGSFKFWIEFKVGFVFFLFYYATSVYFNFLKNKYML